MTCSVALEAEDQRDVDADALAEDLGDRRPALGGAGDLDAAGWAGRPRRAELLADVDGGLGVVGQVGGDLDGDPAVDAVGGVEDRPQDVAGVADVVGGQREDRLVDVGAVDARARAPASS